MLAVGQSMDDVEKVSQQRVAILFELCAECGEETWKDEAAWRAGRIGVVREVV